MELSTGLILFAAAYAAQVIGTVTGFGSATLLLPVMSCFMDIKLAIPLVAVYHMTANFTRLLSYGRSARWRVVAFFGLAAVACAVAGAQLTLQLPSKWLEVLLGLFLLAYVAYSFMHKHKIQVPDRALVLMGSGALSGLFAGLLGTGGPVRAMCLLGLRLPKEAYLGTSAAIALWVDFARLPVYIQGGLMRSVSWPLLGLLIGAACLGIFAGRRLVAKLSALWVTRCVLVLLAILGVRFLFKGWGL